MRGADRTSPDQRVSHHHLADRDQVPASKGQRGLTPSAERIAIPAQRDVRPKDW